MRPDQFHKRMRAICSQPNANDVMNDALLVIVSLTAEEMVGYAEGIRVLQERLHPVYRYTVMGAS